MIAFAYVYNISDTSIVCPGQTDILFSNNGPLLAVTHTAGTAPVTVLEGGIYKIDYSLHLLAGVGASFALTVNGTVLPSTVINSAVSIGEISGSQLLLLAAGDVVRLRNNSLTTVSLDIAPGTAARLTLVRIGV